MEDSQAPEVGAEASNPAGTTASATDSRPRPEELQKAFDRLDMGDVSVVKAACARSPFLMPRAEAATTARFQKGENMTRDEEKTVEQRTRIREARFMLRSVADDAGLSIPLEMETHLRQMARDLQMIESGLDETLTVKSRRADAGKSRAKG